MGCFLCDITRGHRSLAIAVGLLMRGGKTLEDAVAAIQARFESFGAKAHTPLLRAVNQEIQAVRDADAVAKSVLGY